MHDLSQANETTSYCAMWQRCCRGSRWHCSSMSLKNGRKRKPQGVEISEGFAVWYQGFLEGKKGSKKVLKELYKKRKEQKSQTNTPQPVRITYVLGFQTFPSHNPIFFTRVKMVKWGKLEKTFKSTARNFHNSCAMEVSPPPSQSHLQISKCYGCRFPFGMKHLDIWKKQRNYSEGYVGGISWRFKTWVAKEVWLDVIMAIRMNIFRIFQAKWLSKTHLRIQLNPNEAGKSTCVFLISILHNPSNLESMGRTVYLAIHGFRLLLYGQLV